jgi:hypothetical protein
VPSALVSKLRGFGKCRSAGGAYPPLRAVPGWDVPGKVQPGADHICGQP